LSDINHIETYYQKVYNNGYLCIYRYLVKKNKEDKIIDVNVEYYAGPRGRPDISKKIKHISTITLTIQSARDLWNRKVSESWEQIYLNPASLDFLRPIDD